MAVYGTPGWAPWGILGLVLAGANACGGAAGSDDAVIPAAGLSAASANIAPHYRQFGNLTLCVGRGGWMEWSADLHGGRCYVHFLYASGEVRPCRLAINGREEPDEVLGGLTGGFMPENLRWQTCGPWSLPKGKSSIRIATAGLMPHLRGLVVSPHQDPPKPSVFGPISAELPAPELDPNFPGLRAAIVHLAETYPQDYLRSKDYLARLDAMEQQWKASKRKELAGALARLRREALVTPNPLLAFDKLLFIKRYTYQSSHYYTDYIDGCERFGGNLCVLSLAGGKVTELVPQLRGGIFGRFDLSFDGRRVVFDYKARQDAGFRLFEVGVDGRGLRQITFDPPDEAQRVARYRHRDLTSWAGRPVTYEHRTDDMHPCLLPDGGIAFVSTRCERGILCDGPDLFTTTTLYRVDADGKNLRVLSGSPLSESTPSVTNDGRLLYTRWEYVDKGDVVIKCLWAMRPDGSHSAEVFGNDVDFPDGFLYGRAIPGSGNLFVSIGVPHMPLGVGTVIRVDVNRPIRTRRPMTYVTPDVDVRTEWGFFHRRNGRWEPDREGPLFADPYPLSERFFLVSCNPDRLYNDESAYGLYLLDDFGNCVPIYRDEEMSCWQPVPLCARERPPAIPPVSPPAVAPGQDPGEPQATVVMTDVYRGLEGVPPGTIKYLRVMETVARPWAARHSWDGDDRYQQHAVVSMNTHLHVKVLHGLVPVEADGSASFRVPADKNLFFQALDGEFMEVQRMRTFVDFRPGEVRACIGCHQARELAPANRPVAALRHPPHALAPQPGERAPRPLDYAADVQPVLDRHCVRCHGPQRRDGDLDLCGELTELFNRSYESLLTRDLVRVVRENDPKTGNALPVPPYTLGSHASRLITLLRQGHEEVLLSREEWIKLVTWVDANAPYYGSYFGRRNLKHLGHPDFRPTPRVPHGPPARQ